MWGPSGTSYPRRGTRTPNLLFVREALSAIELPAGNRGGTPWFPHGPSFCALHGSPLAGPPGRQSRPPAATAAARINVRPAGRRPGPTRTGARGFEAHCSLPLSYGALFGRRQQGSNLRTRSTRAYAVAGRCLSTRPCLRARVPACIRRGRAAHASLRVRELSLMRDGPGRRRTCNPPGKSRELCLLSYGAGTEGEGVEPPSP